MNEKRGGKIQMDKPHKKLEVWKQSMELVIELYKIIDKFPKEEKYILSDQIKRATISIPSNIACPMK